MRPRYLVTNHYEKLQTRFSMAMVPNFSASAPVTASFECHMPRRAPLTVLGGSSCRLGLDVSTAEGHSAILQMPVSLGPSSSAKIQSSVDITCSFDVSHLLGVRMDARSLLSATGQI